MFNIFCFYNYRYLSFDNILSPNSIIMLIVINLELCPLLRKSERDCFSNARNDNFGVIARNEV